MLQLLLVLSPITTSVVSCKHCDAHIYSSSALLELHKIDPGDHDGVYRHSRVNSLFPKQDMHDRVLLLCVYKFQVVS